jgi:hypothetical protein
MKAEIARIKSERAAQLEQDAKDLAEWCGTENTNQP